VKRMTVDMAGILTSLGFGSQQADSFERRALAVLASSGHVDIVSGRALLTASGRALLPKADTVLAKWEASTPISS
jgi:hypothetical protein